MTNRQRLDQILLSVTGEDIRLVGNWERLPALHGDAAEVADRLNTSKEQLLRCRDIADVLDLMEATIIARPEHDSQPSLW